MDDLIVSRLLHQQIAKAVECESANVVRSFGAMQAQDYRNALWAIGLRTRGATEAAVEHAVAEGKIVRTWPMRGTLHFVAAADVHWMLELLTPRILAASVTRALQHGLDEQILARCREICRQTLGGHRAVTREALLAGFADDGIDPGAQRGYHILWRLAQERLICFGPRAGKSPTFVLLDEWVPPSKRLTPSQPLGELARRYFSSHAPATVQDFVWWSGLRVMDARTAVAEAQLTAKVIDGVSFWALPQAPPANSHGADTAHLLPAFDEYLLGYRDRSAVLDAVHAAKVVPGGNGIFLPFIIIGGQVIGTWKRTIKTRSVAVTASTFQRTSKSAQRAIGLAAEEYARFIGSPLELFFARAL